MNEKEAIDNAYQSTMSAIFSVFYQSYTNAKGNPQAEQDAEERFKKGVLHLRHIYQRASELLPK